MGVPIIEPVWTDQNMFWSYHHANVLPEGDTTLDPDAFTGQLPAAHDRLNRNPVIGNAGYSPIDEICITDEGRDVAGGRIIIEIVWRVYSLHSSLMHDHNSI